MTSPIEKIIVEACWFGSSGNMQDRYIVIGEHTIELVGCYFDMTPPFERVGAKVDALATNSPGVGYCDD